LIYSILLLPLFEFTPGRIVKQHLQKHAKEKSYQF
jgi:hypothetical protein